jgi:hypothetical protein
MDWISSEFKVLLKTTSSAISKLAIKPPISWYAPNITLLVLIEVTALLFNCFPFYLLIKLPPDSFFVMSKPG